MVQRLPVRIELDEKQLAEHPLRIGLSTLVEVNTTDRDGEMLASQVREAPRFTRAMPAKSRLSRLIN